MLTTSSLPDPHGMLSATGTTIVLSQPHVITHEDILKFNIGLRLLGEQKKQRYLRYMSSFSNASQQRQEGTL